LRACITASCGHLVKHCIGGKKEKLFSSCLLDVHPRSQTRTSGWESTQAHGGEKQASPRRSLTPTASLFVRLVADGWCWFVLREKYCWLVANGWFGLREKHCWLVADKPSEQSEHPWHRHGLEGRSTRLRLIPCATDVSLRLRGGGAAAAARRRDASDHGGRGWRGARLCGHGRRV
jgi:hypothetical protein